MVSPYILEENLYISEMIISLCSKETNAGSLTKPEKNTVELLLYSMNTFFYHFFLKSLTSRTAQDQTSMFCAELQNNIRETTIIA